MASKTIESNLHMNQLTNQTNYNIANETNKYNWEINQANLDYARESWRNEVANEWAMWNAENQYNAQWQEYWYNKYNSPEAIVRQKREAGLNPYVSQGIGQGSSSSGSTSSMGSPSHNQPSMIPMQAARMEPYYRPVSDPAAMFSALAQQVGTLGQLHLQKAQAAGVDIDNQYRATRNALELSNLLANNKNINERTKGQILSNTYDGMSMSARLAQVEAQPRFLTQQIRAVELQNMCQELRIPYISKYAQTEIDKMVSETALNWQRKNDGKRLTDAQVKLFYEQALKTERERLNLPPMTAKQTQRLAEAMVTTAEYNSDILRSEEYLRRYDANIKSDRETSPFGWQRAVENGLDLLGSFIPKF